MRLGIDLDGVVANFDDGWRARYRAEFGTSRALEETAAWDGLHRLTHFPDMAEFWDWAHQCRLFRHLEPLPGALAGLTTLAAAGHDIVILTSKPDRTVPDTLRWIADHELPTREIHFLHKKHEVACDVYLDDSPVVLPALVTCRPTALVCRMVAPWNTPVAGAVDVTGWSAFLTVVARHVQQRQPVAVHAQTADHAGGHG